MNDLQIKEEITNTIKTEAAEERDEEYSEIIHDAAVKTEEFHDDNDTAVASKVDQEEENNVNTVKEEDLTAERGLQEVAVKYEFDDTYQQYPAEPQEEEVVEDVQIKLEPEHSLGENKIVSIGVIHEGSIHNGLLEHKYLKYGPVPVELQFSKRWTPKMNMHPEEILPTINPEHYSDYSDPSLQYNSITSDMMTLEQQAYGLLKAKSIQSIECTLVECQKCNKTFKKASMKYHMKVHDTIERRAMGILKGLKTKATKKKNLELENAKYKLNTDSGRGQFNCEYCGKNYIMKKSLLRHQNICKGAKVYEVPIENLGDLPMDVAKPVSNDGEYLCHCGKAYHRRSRMETCLRSHSLDVVSQTFYSCATCSKVFIDKKDLALHRKSHNKRKQYPCKFCPTDYSTPKELFKHLRKHQKVQLMEYKVISEVVNGKQALKCFMCSKTCKELSELKLHVTGDHKEPYTCSHCNENFPNIIDFASHTKTLHPEVEGQSVLDVLEAFSKLAQSWKCEDCELQFDQPGNLAMHQAEQHMVNNDKSDVIAPQFLCVDCSRVFMTAKRLATHRRMIHHCVEPVNNGAVEEHRDLSLMCVHCRKICKDDSSLNSHMRLHSPDRKYVCKYCDFRFMTLEKKKSHMLIHTGDMKYVCFKCEYRCSSENRLNMHKQSPKHLSIKETLLASVLTAVKESVPKDLVQEASKSSVKSNSMSEPSTCNVCGETFASESKMLDHKQTHPFIEFSNEDEPTRIFFK